MKKLFLFCLVSFLAVTLCSCRSKMVINDKSTPMTFELAEAYPGNDFIIKESSLLIKNILPGKWKMYSEKASYFLTTVENPGERNISSVSENQTVKTELIFSNDGKCRLKNDILLDCASSYGQNTVWEGSWNVIDGVLVLDIELVSPNGIGTGKLTVKADVNIVNPNSINLYWKQDSVEKAEKKARDIIKKRFPSKKLSAAVDVIELYYGIDDFVYRTFSHTRTINDKYYRKTIVKEISKISHPIFKRAVN